MAAIAIVGPGAIGGVIASQLARTGRHSLLLAARTAFERLIVEDTDGRVEHVLPVVTRSEQAQPVDWVMVATKAYDALGAARWLEAACGPRTRVAVLQNGVEHRERFARWVAPARIVPVIVDCPASRIAPGHVRQRGPTRLMVEQSRDGAEFAELFASSKTEVIQSSSFQSEAWKKLCLNVVGALSAVTSLPAGIAQHAGIADSMRGLVRECVAVARAEGAELDDALIDQIVARCRAAPPDGVNSLLADRRAGRPLEIDARNGAVTRLGRKHGLPTPLNDLVVALLEVIEAGAHDGSHPRCRGA